MRSKRSKRKSTTWPGKQFTGCAPLSPELRGVAISLFVHCLNPTSQYPQPAYKLVPHGLDTVQTQAERNDAVQTYGGWPKLSPSARGCVIAHSS